MAWIGFRLRMMRASAFVSHSGRRAGGGGSAHCAVSERTFVSNSRTLSRIVSRNVASCSSEPCRLWKTLMFASCFSCCDCGCDIVCSFMVVIIAVMSEADRQTELRPAVRYRGVAGQKAKSRRARGTDRKSKAKYGAVEILIA